MTEPRTTGDLLRAAAVLLFAIGQIATIGFERIIGTGESITVRAEAVRTSLTPAGYAFAIWGLIYLTNLVLALWQALPAQWARAEWRAAGWWMALAYLCNTAWQMLVPVFGFTILSAVILFILAFAAVMAVRQFQAAAPARVAPGLVLRAQPLGLLAGWAIAASVVGLPSVIVFGGWATQADFAGGTPAFAVIAAALGLGIAGLVAMRGNLAALAALAWAFAAVYAANRGNAGWADGEGYAVLASLGVAVLTAAFLLIRSRPGRRLA